MTLTGFTLELDGNPDAVKRLYDALTAEWACIIADATHERDITAFVLLESRFQYLRPVNPVHGTISLRHRV